MLGVENYFGLCLLFRMNKNIIDEFDGWNIVKKDLELHGRCPKISEGQIWWSGVGRNVGTELNGKNSRYSRPVIIYKKICGNKFMAIPLSSKIHEGSWYVPFDFGGKHQVAVICDAKTLSVKRLYRMMGTLSVADYKKIHNGFLELFG